MSQGGYVVLAWFRPREADKEAFAGLMREATAKVRSDGNARQYEFHTSADDGAEFILYEDFATQADWQAHHDRPAMVRLRNEIDPMVAEQDRSVWSQVVGFVKQDAAPGHTTGVTHRSAIKATFFLYSIGIGVMRG